jgi:gluconate 2-dehydrogenase gamma chain
MSWSSYGKRFFETRFFYLMKKDRRAFLRGFCLTCGGFLIVPSCTRSYPRWHFFTDGEAALLTAIAEQFVPADEDPGATDARVINFFDKQLVGPYTKYQPLYRNGLRAVESSVYKLHNASFTDLNGAKQRAFLERMERGELAKEEWQTVDQRSFFKMLLDHTMQGFYGSPRHGGNCNYVSYKMMKIDYPHVIGQNRYGARAAGVRKDVI